MQIKIRSLDKVLYLFLPKAKENMKKYWKKHDA